ncbi:MAG: gamma carbonic anhydrase family protein [Spirochaetes bacterium]|nr:gamma carbonic anhydrase family protein [Spirochaetota bacterium]
MKYDLGDRRIIIEGDDCFIAETAVVVGSVRIGNNASVWFNAVVRADDGVIVIGESSNIQDGAVLHCDSENDLVIGRGVTVAHKAMLHSCTVGDNSLIGINAVVLNGAVIGKNCLVGAGALVLEKSVIPDNSVVLGAPAKVARPVTPEQIDEMLDAAEHYIRNFKNFKKNLKKIQ